MSWGIIVITKNGVNTALKINKKIPGSVIYTLPKWNNGYFKSIQKNFNKFIKSIFNKHEILIFIMACGIAVRSISSLIKDKITDPGVLVIDDKGKFVISLLSGHIGGANNAALKVSEIIKAQPVITTASDVNEKISVDILAKDNNLSINDMKQAKTITAMIVNNEKVCLKSDIKIDVPKYLEHNEKDTSGIIYIGNKNREFKKPCVMLIPKNIVLGIGCKRNTSKNKIIYFIKKTLLKLNIDKKSIKAISTIDIKNNEKGIIKSAKHYNCLLKFFSKEQISKVQYKFSKSDFVKSITGTENVSESCAFLGSSKKGEFLIKKEISDGITLSIFEEKL